MSVRVYQEGQDGLIKRRVEKNRVQKPYFIDLYPYIQFIEVHHLIKPKKGGGNQENHKWLLQTKSWCNLIFSYVAPYLGLIHKHNRHKVLNTPVSDHLLCVVHVLITNQNERGRKSFGLFPTSYFKQTRLVLGTEQ